MRSCELTFSDTPITHSLTPMGKGNSTIYIHSGQVMKQNNVKNLKRIQFSRSVVSDSLRPHESQHTRPPCPSPTPRVRSDSRPSSRWCHPAKTYIGLPWWLSGKESTCQCGRWGFNPWVRKIPWRKKWQPTPLCLPEKSHGQRSLMVYNSWDCKRVRHDLETKQQQHIYIRYNVHHFQSYDILLLVFLTYNSHSPKAIISYTYT